MNMKRAFWFQVSVVNHTRGHFAVDGRCLRGPIALGDIFTEFSAMSFISTPDLGKTTVLEPNGRVTLKVKSILVFGRSIEEIVEGYTARLEVTGVGAELLTDGIVLT